MQFRELLAHPRTRGLDLDDPQTTLLRRSLIQNKGLLRRIYEEWYAALADALPAGDEPVLEIGSGAGFLNDFMPRLITTDILPLDNVSVVADAHHLPFERASLRAILMINVLHHLSSPRQFLSEAARCVRPGGRLIALEPWTTAWSRFVYGRLHHEPFDPNASDWGFPQQGPLSGANGALPWILFERDRQQFQQEFPMWRIQRIDRRMPFRYLLSGGVSLRSLAPGWTFPFWRGVERCLHPWMRTWAMFALIVLDREAIEGPTA